MLAYMFPGQGSQFRGMGKDLFERYPEQCRLARDVLGYPIEDLCCDDKNDTLNRTSYTQPAVFFVSCLAYLAKRAEVDVAPDFVLGHSVGLYAALFAAGVIDLRSGLEIVARRGRLMEESSAGAMLAVIGDNLSAIPDLLIKHGHYDIDMANHNSPEQTVVSGPSESIEAASRDLQQEGFRCIRLAVSGPFHSRYMDAARVAFLRYLIGKAFQKPSVAVISTTSGCKVTLEYLLEELSFQLIRPVRWLHTVRYLSRCYPSLTFEEVGPGRVLSQFNIKIISPTKSRSGSEL